MSENKKYSLTEYVFRDIRIIEKPRKDSYLAVVKKALLDETDPVKKVQKYQSIMGDKYNHKKPDAERWSIALDSYKKYPCFQSDDYCIKMPDLCYTKDGQNIRISADTLTGPSEIIDPAIELGLEKHESLKQFCSAAYTIGNICPVMANPGGSPGSDTCWSKLERFHNTIKHKIIKGTMDANWNNNISKRYAENMFAVFPDNLSGRKIVDRLMLNDYYDDDYRLIINKPPQEYADLGVDEYISFIQLVTTLIIKRGIRIYNALPAEMKK